MKTPQQALPIKKHNFILALALVAGGVSYRWALRTQERQRQQEWKTYTVKPGDTLEELAKKYDTNWKYITKTNQLKPPYSLEVGDKIKLPSAAEAPAAKKDEK